MVKKNSLSKNWLSGAISVIDMSLSLATTNPIAQATAITAETLLNRVNFILQVPLIPRRFLSDKLARK